MKIQDDILSYREMCDAEQIQTLQRGMNFRLNPRYSVILMSQRTNAPYRDKIHPDGVTIEYEGHDVMKNSYAYNPKNEDQPEFFPSGKRTQNGLFIDAVKRHKENRDRPETIKVYEKIMSGVWSLKGYFDLIDYKVIHDDRRNVFRFILRLSEKQAVDISKSNINLRRTRLIPSEVKKEVWKRDGGKCVLCGSKDNLHFDHELPYSKGGTGLSVRNVRLLCMKHNLMKSGKIE